MESLDSDVVIRLPLLKSASFLLFLLTRTTGEVFFRRVEVRSCLEKSESRQYMQRQRWLQLVRRNPMKNQQRPQPT